MKKILILIVTVFLLACGSQKITITNPVELHTGIPETAGYRWLNDPEPAFDEVTLKEALRLFDEKGTGILYFGGQTCPICQRAVPEINTVLKKLGVRMYYVDTDILTGKEEFERLMELTKDHLTKNDDGSISFQVPRIFIIQNGEVIDTYLGLQPSVTLETEDQQLTSAQKRELQGIYEEMIRKIAD